MTDFSIEDYTDKSLLVRGDRELFGDFMKQYKGRWSDKLKGGAGWLVSKEYTDALCEALEYDSKYIVKRNTKTSKVNVDRVERVEHTEHDVPQTQEVHKQHSSTSSQSQSNKNTEYDPRKGMNLPTESKLRSMVVQSAASNPAASNPASRMTSRVSARSTVNDILSRSNNHLQTLNEDEEDNSEIKVSSKETSSKQSRAPLSPKRYPHVQSSSKYPSGRSVLSEDIVPENEDVVSLAKRMKDLLQRIDTIEGKNRK